MQLIGRGFRAGSGYRFGFNGKELDQEVVQYDYGFRIYDPRLVRFKSVDPLIKSFPSLTPFQFSSNSPIMNIDLDGAEATNYWAAMKAKINGVESLKMNNAQDVQNIQFQQYRLVIQNPSQSLNGLFRQIGANIGSVYNTDYGKFKFEKQNTRNTVSTGDYIRIDPAQKGLADIFVKVVGVNTTKDANDNVMAFDMQFRTLEGHAEVGTINFSARTMTDTKHNSFIHFMIESTSQVDPTIGQILDGVSNNIRSQQVDNWSQTMGNILNFTGGEKKHASVYIETYENGVFNKDFKIEKNNGFSIGSPKGVPKKIEQRTLPANSPSGN